MDLDVTDTDFDLLAEKIRIDEREYDNMTDDVAVKNRNVGLDIGTMNIVSAIMTDSNEVKTSSLRNVFLKVDTDSLGTRDLSLISHTKIEDDVYILSDDAYTFGNIFGMQVSRPMSQGMVSSSEIDAIDILGIMVKSLIGTAPTPQSTCCYSIPANPIDVSMNVLFHDNVFKRLISQLGWNPISLYEGVSLIYSECADSDFTGIGISFGAGMTNIAVVFKGVIALKFSLARGGDWIDQNVANHIAGMVSNRVTVVKEKDNFDIFDFNIGDKKERRIREALSYYYQDLIQYATQQIVKELSTIETQFPSKVPVIISGGTSKPNGFLNMISKTFSEHSFPFEISEVRYAANPLTAVAEGCLVRSFRD